MVRISWPYHIPATSSFPPVVNINDSSTMRGSCVQLYLDPVSLPVIQKTLRSQSQQCQDFDEWPFIINVFASQLLMLFSFVPFLSKREGTHYKFRVEFYVRDKINGLLGKEFLLCIIKKDKLKLYLAWHKIISWKCFQCFGVLGMT